MQWDLQRKDKSHAHLPRHHLSLRHDQGHLLLQGKLNSYRQNRVARHHPTRTQERTRLPRPLRGKGEDAGNYRGSAFGDVRWCELGLQIEGEAEGEAEWLGLRHCLSARQAEEGNRGHQAEHHALIQSNHNRSTQINHEHSFIVEIEALQNITSLFLSDWRRFECMNILFSQ